MTVFMLPKGLCEEIELIMNSFWWGCESRGGRGIRWGRWNDLCRPKKYGGMGFRRVREMNMALLGKQEWKFLTDPEALVTRVFKARYFPNCSFLEAGEGSNPSFVWSSIREAQVLIHEGVRWRIGDGGKVRVWGDPWLPDVHQPYITTPDLGYLNAPNVASLMCTDHLSWDCELVRDIFNARDFNQIMSLPLPLVSRTDSIYWGREESGVYSVKSAYRVAREGFDVVGEVCWAGIWKLNIPPKMKCFFWALCTLRLPTKDALILK